MSVRPIVIESQIRADRIRAQEASHQTLHRITTIQAMFPDLPLGSYFDDPSELPRIGGRCPQVAVFQCSDILEPVVAWQNKLWRGGIAPLAYGPGSSTLRVCLINACHEEKAGGDWISSVNCQEDSICRRSTLYHALCTPAHGERKRSFFPLEHGGVYSPNVVVHRDGPSNFYEMYPTPERCTVVSVVSVPPERTPMLGVDGSYSFELERDLQLSKMKCALRMAAKHRHRNIVVGSFGSVNREVPEYSTRRSNRGGGLGGQGPLHDERRDINPIREVSKMWAELLDYRGSEFAGCFDNVVFVVGVGQRATDESHALNRAFRLPDTPRLMKEWFPGQYDFAYP